jgi:hypothetical protein
VHNVSSIAERIRKRRLSFIVVTHQGVKKSSNKKATVIGCFL